MSVNPSSRILLLIPHLGGGGAERVISLLAQGLDHEKYELHLGLITQAETGPEKLPPWVCVHPLGAVRVRAGALKLIKLIRRLNPDLILSGMFHLNFLVLVLLPFFPQKTRVIIRQNGTVSASLAMGPQPWYTRPLYRSLYHNADSVICQTQAMADDLAAELGLQTSMIEVLPNPVDVEGIRNLFGEELNLWPESGQHLLAVGRLSREKGFDLLLQALAMVRRQIPDATLVIAGTGPEEARLKAECRALGLDAAVRFVGYLACPRQCFPKATIFVLPSRHEGLPNALLEAAAGGLPIVALPASGGLVELLRDRPGVWLAPEVTAEALAASLLAALRDVEPAERFAHVFVEDFRMDRAIKAYEELIDRTLKKIPR
jgi:glycosyltransferase involved in cell wall biosynthesis